MPTPISHTSPLIIRFRDLDSYGHVNNAVYLTYLEEARMAFFKEQVGANWDWVNHGVLLAKHEINYLAPIFLNDHAEITITFQHVGTKSITVGFEIFKKHKGQTIKCTHGATVLVCFDYKQQKSIPVPESWKALFFEE